MVRNGPLGKTGLLLLRAPEAAFNTWQCPAHSYFTHNVTCCRVFLMYPYPSDHSSYLAVITVSFGSSSCCRVMSLSTNSPGTRLFMLVMLGTKVSETQWNPVSDLVEPLSPEPPRMAVLSSQIVRYYDWSITAEQPHQQNKPTNKDHIDLVQPLLSPHLICVVGELLEHFLCLPCVSWTGPTPVFRCEFRCKDTQQIAEDTIPTNFKFVGMQNTMSSFRFSDFCSTWAREPQKQLHNHNFIDGKNSNIWLVEKPQAGSCFSLFWFVVT